jgi:hypothetical protein
VEERLVVRHQGDDWKVSLGYSTVKGVVLGFGFRDSMKVGMLRVIVKKEKAQDEGKVYSRIPKLKSWAFRMLWKSWERGHNAVKMGVEDKSSLHIVGKGEAGPLWYMRVISAVSRREKYPQLG